MMRRHQVSRVGSVLKQEIAEPMTMTGMQNTNSQPENACTTSEVGMLYATRDRIIPMTDIVRVFSAHAVKDLGLVMLWIENTIKKFMPYSDTVLEQIIVPNCSDQRAPD